MIVKWDAYEPHSLVRAIILEAYVDERCEESQRGLGGGVVRA